MNRLMDNHPNLLATDTKAFNSKLMDYLIWYNTKRVHKGLENLSPIDFLLKYYPESQMYGIYTKYCKKLYIIVKYKKIIRNGGYR
ncbi:MAG: IS3 family transposase [Caldisericaceae bacterium]|nr:IS3 family transposase [Caldisericaceae bacterium]